MDGNVTLHIDCHGSPQRTCHVHFIFTKLFYLSQEKALKSSFPSQVTSLFWVSIFKSVKFRNKICKKNTNGLQVSQRGKLPHTPTNTYGHYLPLGFRLFVRFLHFECFVLEFSTLRFRVCGVSFSCFGCSVFEFSAFRFRVQFPMVITESLIFHFRVWSASLSSFGCFGIRFPYSQNSNQLFSSNFKFSKLLFQ